MLLRCPQCGGGPLFDGLLRSRESCPQCGLQLERGEEGYRNSGLFLNLLLSGFLFLVVMVGVVTATWPTPPWNLIQYGGAALVVLLPIGLYRHVRVLFLAYDLYMRPAGSGDTRDYQSPRT